MEALFLCVTRQHDLSLVLLAALICGLGVCSAFVLAREALRSQDRRTRLLWSGAGVVATASAIWATHFIAMLAFEPGLPFRLATGPTILSFFVALTLVAAAAAVVLRAPSPSGRALGGALAGLAIAAMHYVGMGAFRTQGAVSWNLAVVCVSILAGTGLAGLSALLASRAGRPWRYLAPVTLLVAVCALHFTAMTAVTIRYDPSVPPPTVGLDKTVLAIAIANVAALIVGLALASAWLATRDRRQRTAEEHRMRDLADVSVEGLLLCDGETVVGMNHSLEAMLGRERDALIGRPLTAFLPHLARSEASAAIDADTVLAVEGSEAIPVKVISKAISVAGRARTVFAVRDQRERIGIENRMRELAHQDVLTGLANRLTFTETLAERFGSRREADRLFALLMLDLDRFKIVNDTLGHGVGDELLRRVAGRLTATIREGDLLARLGGDEFSIVLAHAETPADVAEVADRIIDVMERPFIIDGQIVDIGASIGVAFAPGDGEAPDSLSRSADLALYRAKEEGRGVYRFFEQDMNARMQSRRAFEQDLRRAIVREEFEVVYQPQVEAGTGAYDGAEALVRWNHPVRGTVSPADFIPLAEELGLIVPLGEYVLRTACAQATTWPSHMSVAVNLSPVQLRDARLAASVARILDETGLAPSRLELELTENALLNDDGRTIAVLHAIRALGVRISMDDFGTGYSSLSYLRRFPFDKIKIDQSFVRQLPGDPDSIAIVQAVATLGVKLGLKVTAEGVETEEQQRFTVAEGCHQLQGFLISRPVSAATVAELFAGPKAAVRTAA